MGRIERTAAYYTDRELQKKYNLPVKKGKRTLSVYERLRNRIRREFPKKKLIGDISINDEEFNLLVEYLQIFYRYIQLFDWEICTDQLICVTMVQIGIRYYDGGYWSHFGKLLNNENWNVNRQAIMGKVCVETFKAYGKFVNDENDRINTILMHGFVANKYVSNLLDFLFAYYRIDLERDLSRNDRDTMRELIKSIQNKDNSNRTYKLIQQTSDAVRANPRGGNVRLRWLLRLIDASFWDEYIHVNSENRLVHAFTEWAAKSKDFGKIREGRGVKQRAYSSPYLYFDISKGSFSVRLPAQIIRSADVSTWSCIIGKREVKKSVEAYESVLAYKTESTLISIDGRELFECMVFNLSYAENLKRFTLSSERVRFFTKDGYSINVTSLKKGEFYAFSRKEDIIESTAVIECRPFMGLKFYYLSVENGDIIKLPGEMAVSVGKKVEEGLLKSGRLNDIYVGFDALPIYNKVPSVLIKTKSSSLHGTAIFINDIKYRLLDKCSITEIELEDGSYERGYWFSLEDIGCKKNGMYSIEIDVPNDRSIRKWRFALISGLEFQFDNTAPYIFSAKGTIFLNAPKATVIPVSANIEPDKEIGYFNFNIMPNVNIISFKVNDIVVSVIVPQLEYSFDCLTWYTQQYAAIWHADLPRKLWVRYPASRISLEMDNGEVTDQEMIEVYDKRVSDNIFECDLTRFRSWINHNRMKNTIIISILGRTIPFVDIIGCSYVVNCYLEANPQSNQFSVSCNIIGKGNYYLDLYYSKSIVVEKVPIVEGRAIIERYIHSGKYYVEIFESDDANDFEFDDIEYISIHKTSTDIVNPHDLSGKRIVLLSIMKNENDIFKMSLSHNYKIKLLEQLEDDEYRYKGVLSDSSVPQKQIDVVFEILDFNRLRYALISWIEPDYGDEVEFLYDNYNKVLVCEEETGLRSAESYRRYNCIFTDEYLYEFTFTIV